MIQQVVKGRPVSAFRGVLIIIALAASIVLVSWVERAIALSTGFQYGAFAVWALVIAEAVAIMRLSVMGFRYTVSDGHFFVERVYGDHARIVHDVPLDAILAVGGREDVFHRYGSAQAYEKAVMKHCPLPEKALAYRGKSEGDPARLLLIQPDAAILAALNEAAAKAAQPEDAPAR